ncbi:MAG: NUMOD4 domain-containing protein [Hyphomicrobium sp.]
MVESHGNTSEEWRKVTGYPSYSVSTSGAVRRDIAANGFAAGRPIKPRLNIDGYVTVVLCAKGQKPRGLRVHRLIAIEFIPNPLGLPCINHIDGVKTNNAISNLEWVTPKMNTAHAVRNGLMKPAKGDSHWSRRMPEKARKNLGALRGKSNAAAKITEGIVREARLLAAQGMRHRDIAARYGVCRSSVSNVVKKATWAHVE